MQTFGGQNILENGVFNSTVPIEGPKAIPVTLDFTGETTWLLDLTQQTQNKIISFIQCMFVDNSMNTQPLAIFCQTTRQTIVCPPLSQGYVPVLTGRPPVFQLESTGGVVVSLQFLNVPMPLGFWSIKATGLNLDDMGNALVTMPTLDALISDEGGGPGLAVNVIGGGGGGGGGGLRLPADYKLRSASPSYGFNQTILAAAPRFYLNAIEIYAPPQSFITGGGVLNISIKQGGDILLRASAIMPSAAVTATAGGPVGPTKIASFVNLDFWSTVDNENLVCQLNQDMFGDSLVVNMACGTGVAP